MAEAPDAGGSRAAPDAAQALAALTAAAPPLALVDAAGRVSWCSQAFADAVAGVAAGELQGTPVAAWLDEGGEARGLRWRVESREAADGARLLQLLPVADDERQPQQVAELQERLDLLQEFCRAGIFERDPVTQQGRWDAQMYRIFGLPVPPPGTPAPPYDEVRRMFLPEDVTVGGFRATLHQPGVHADRVRLRRPDGEIRHIHSQWKVFHDGQGRAVRVLGVNIDDTEVYRLARQTQALREELDLVLQLSDIGLWRHDLATGLIHADERAARHSGLPHRPEGMTVAEARTNLHPDDLPAVRAAAETCLHTGHMVDQAIRYRRPDGGWRHVLSRRTLQRDADGRPVAFVGVLLDETERVERTRQAQLLAQRLESAAEAARIGLWSATAEGDGLPDWNRRMFELLGLDPAAGTLSLGDWLRRCVHADDRERVARLAAHWIREGSGPIELEFRIVRPADGLLRWLVVRGQVSQPTPDSPRRVEGVAIDITEQQQTLQRLRESADRLALTISAVGMGTWEASASHDAGLWDEGMFRLRGRESGSPEGRRLVSRDEMAGYLHPEDRDFVMSDQHRHVAGGGEWRLNFRVVWPDGTVRWMASRSALVRDERGQAFKRIGLNWDITESVLAEQAMREREVAIAESRAKSRFLSRVSHELRTPLNAVMGFTQLLLDVRAPAGAAQRERWLLHIHDAARHLLALIDDVLDLSRAASGDLRLNLQPVDLAALVASTVPLVEGEARQRDVTLQAAPGLAGHVLADPVRLRQVLVNLLSNAVKYNRPGGRVQVDVERQGPSLCLHVSDTGRGIDPALLRHAFEPFNRLGAEGQGIEGTGIGLAIAKSLVEQMQGRISARSQPGQGSVFTVELPCSDAAATSPGVVPAAAPAAATPGMAQAGVQPAPARVLYIEDNEVNALLVREVLAPHAWVQLEVVADGRSGLQRARESRPDLVLLDMQLPDMDGLAVLRALRADPATAGLRSVALSANAMPDDIDAARAAGAVDYWTKPIRFPDFVERLQALLRAG